MVFCFSGYTSSSTCEVLASLQLGMGGRASSLAGLVDASNRAYCGSSCLVAAMAGGAALKAGAACERYCWFSGRESKASGAGAGGAVYVEGL